MRKEKKPYDKEREREMDTIIGTAISLGAFSIAIIACAVALMKGAWF
nr:MAG TPA: Putative Holin-like Toxin (Hol-Tox) [Caudoviricetes sp.]